MTEKLRVCDIPEINIKKGLRIVSLSNGRLGTVTDTYHNDDRYSVIWWDGELTPYSGFYGNDCKCELAFQGDNIK